MADQAEINGEIGYVRIAYNPVFIPAGTQNGKWQDECIKFNVIGNSFNGYDANRVPQFRTDEFKINMWGNRTAFGKWLSKGRLVSLKVQMQTGDKRMYNADGSPIMLPDNTQLVCKGYTFYKVTRFVPLMESSELVAMEAARGWNRDNLNAGRKAMTYHPTMFPNGSQFGYMEVYIPRGFIVDEKKYANANPQSLDIQHACFLPLAELNKKRAQQASMTQYAGATAGTNVGAPVGTAGALPQGTGYQQAAPATQFPQGQGLPAGQRMRF